MHQRFTDEARKVWQLANQEAHRFSHETIGTEHVLLGLAKEKTGVAAKVLDHMGANLRRIRYEVEKLIEAGHDAVTLGKLPETPAVKQLVDFAAAEADDLDSDTIGTEHLLLGLLKVSDGIAIRALSSMGFKLREVRVEVLKAIRPERSSQVVPLIGAGETFVGYTDNIAWQTPHLFTPGADRALRAGAAFSCGEIDELDLPQVIVGLLAEPECSAARILGRHQIDRNAVATRFPQLAPRQMSDVGLAMKFSRDFEQALFRAQQLLVEYPRPLELATEHLLLGIVAGEGKVARWLREHGLDAAAIEAEVHRLAGHEPGPLPFEADDSTPPFLGTCESPQGAIVESATNEPLSPSDELAALRALDAAANRAGEGLRVVEDYLRFALDDQHLLRVAKQIRHDLAAALAVFPSEMRHAARETQADVGTSVSVSAEGTRGSLASLMAANFKRVEQSLRSLEESAKLLASPAAAALEQLRYRVYTLERATHITRSSLERLAEARLYVLIDGGPSEEAFGKLVDALVEARVSAIQLRDKKLGARELLERAHLLRERTVGSHTLFIVNDRPDLAVLAGADGVHVGQEELSIKDARRILGPRGLIGVSTHSIEQARKAVLDGADYIGVGPTFPSGTKKFAAFTGPELLAAVAAETRLPAFAIGGITAQNLPQVLASGIRRVAVSGAITTAADPAAAASTLLAALSR